MLSLADQLHTNDSGQPCTRASTRSKWLFTAEYMLMTGLEMWRIESMGLEALANNWFQSSCSRQLRSFREKSPQPQFWKAVKKKSKGLSRHLRNECTESSMWTVRLSGVEAGTRALHREALPNTAGVFEHELRQRSTCDTTWGHAAPLLNNSMETCLVSNDSGECRLLYFIEGTRDLFDLTGMVTWRCVWFQGRAFQTSGAVRVYDRGCWFCKAKKAKETPVSWDVHKKKLPSQRDYGSKIMGIFRACFLGELALGPMIVYTASGVISRSKSISWFQKSGCVIHTQIIGENSPPQKKVWTNSLWFFFCRWFCVFFPRKIMKHNQLGHGFFDPAPSMKTML